MNATTKQHDINLRHLRYFQVLADELHFGRAAARLGISQPPLSEQIVALEAALGTRLFERSRRAVVLTASGRTLYSEAGKLLLHAERVREVMAGASSGYAGQLYLGCVPSGLIGVLPQILGRDRGMIGDLEVRVTEGHTGEIIAALHAGQLDAGLVWEDEPDPPLVLRPLEHVRFIAALHPKHPLVRKRRVALRDFTGEPLIVPPRDVTPRQFDRIMTAFREAGLSPRTGQQARSIAAQLGFVASGLGYALVPEYARRVAMTGVVFRPLLENLESSPISLMWNENRVSPQLAAFRRRVDEAFPPRRMPGATVPDAGKRRARRAV
jgi:DNA-binding transcriptional LysR family regulator